MAVREVVRIRGVNQHWDLDYPEGEDAGGLFGRLVTAFKAGEALEFVSPDGGRRRVVINPRDITYLELERVAVAEATPVVVEIPGDTAAPEPELPPESVSEPASTVAVLEAEAESTPDCIATKLPGDEPPTPQ